MLPYNVHTIHSPQTRYAMYIMITLPLQTINFKPVSAHTHRENKNIDSDIHVVVSGAAEIRLVNSFHSFIQTQNTLFSISSNRNYFRIGRLYIVSSSMKNARNCRFVLYRSNGKYLFSVQLLCYASFRYAVNICDTTNGWVTVIE